MPPRLAGYRGCQAEDRRCEMPPGRTDMAVARAEEAVYETS